MGAGVVTRPQCVAVISPRAQRPATARCREPDSAGSGCLASRVSRGNAPEAGSREGPTGVGLRGRPWDGACACLVAVARCMTVSPVLASLTRSRRSAWRTMSVGGRTLAPCGRLTCCAQGQPRANVGMRSTGACRLGLLGALGCRVTADDLGIHQSSGPLVSRASRSEVAEVRWHGPS